MNTEVHLNLHLVNFLIASGILQVFILSGILFVHPNGKRISNQLLALLLLSANFHLTYLLVLDLNLDNLFPPLLWFPFSFLTGIGPLIWLYTRSLNQADFKCSKREVLHFLPLGIELSLQIFQIGYSITLDEMYYNVPSDKVNTPFIYIVAAISIQYYLRKSMKEIDIHEKELAQQFSDIMKWTLQWLKKLISYYRLFWLIWIPFVIVFLVLFRAQVQNFFIIAIAYLLLLFLTYLTYWIGLQGLLKGTAMRVGVFMKREKVGGYSHLEDKEIVKLVEAVKTEMKGNRQYLNPSLSLRSFAETLHMDPNLLSFILNQHLKKSFYEFVNHHRIEAVKKSLAQRDTSKLTLLGIALDCGFNSKTSFNRVFKEMTGTTPSQYLTGLKEN